MANNTNSSAYKALFNQQDYFFKITLSNGDKNSAPLELKYHFIDNLQIEETLNNWYTTGYLVLKNDFEILERGAKTDDKDLSSTIKKDSAITSLYTFRNDGRNKVNVRIFPIFNNNSDNIVESQYPEQWEINYDFVVYNVEDLPANDLSQKRKKLYLWEERYQHFLERNIQWSTYYVAAAAANTTKPLADSTCKVGQAIKHLIQTACGENDLNRANNTSLKVGWLPTDTTGNINNPTIPVASFNDESWDDGAELNKIFYTSPATYNVVDDLDYLLEYYVSTKNTSNVDGLGMPGILRLSRYSKKWELTGIDDIFKTSTNGTLPGKDSIERMYIQAPDDIDVGNALQKVPNFIKNSLIQDINAGPTSTILSYKFVNMADVHDLYINNRPIINYDTNQCIWNIYFKDNTAENVKESFKTEIISKLYGDSNKTGVLIGINKDKINGLNTTPEHSVLQSESVKVLSRNNMIYNNILLNQAIEFTASGLSIRTPGKFLIIDREGSKSPAKNDFEDKFIGQWLITKVVHSFARDKYTTETVAVKVNSFSELAAFKPENDIFKE